MKFRLPERLGVLRLDGADYEGFEITCRMNMPVGMMLDFTAAARRSTLDSGASDDEKAAALGLAIDLFAEHALRSWNLEDEHGDVPADAAGLRTLDPMVLGQVFKAYVQLTTTVPVPLDEPSDDTPESDNE